MAHWKIAPMAAEPRLAPQECLGAQALLAIATGRSLLACAG